MLTKISQLKKYFSKDEKDQLANESVPGSLPVEKVGGESSEKNVKPEDSQKDEVLIKDNAVPKPDEVRKEHTVEEIKEEVIKVLKTCYDPEIPVDVFELGLIYDVKVATNGDVLIEMTLTSPSCPVAGTLPNEIEQKVKDHPMVNDCKVQLTFDPPWSQKNMSEVAKLELGFL